MGGLMKRVKRHLILSPTKYVNRPRSIMSNSYLIECAEITYFTIEVDADSENEARELARADINSFDIIDEYVSEWDINEIRLLDEDGCAV